MAEGPLPAYLIRWFGPSLRGVSELVEILRSFLARSTVRAPSGVTLDGYRFSHKTFRTFITSPCGPLPLADDARELRQRILDFYSPPGSPDPAGTKPAQEWDEYGLGSFIQLCLRHNDVPQAVATLKRYDFIESVSAARGFGVDALRRMVTDVREAIGDIA